MPRLLLVTKEEHDFQSSENYNSFSICCITLENKSESDMQLYRA